MRVNQFLNMYIFLAGGDRAAGKIDESMIKNESAVCFAYVKTDRGVRPCLQFTNVLKVATKYPVAPAYGSFTNS
jgi:hypothetical protein